GVEGSVGISLLGATAYLGQSGDKFTQIHGLRYKNNSYLLGAMDTKGEYKPNFIDYQTYMSYQFNQKWELSFLGNYSRNGYTFIPKNRETTFGGMMTTYNFKVYFDGQEKDVFSTYFGSLNLNYKPNNNLKFNLIASSFNTNELETYDINGEYYLDEIMVDPNTGKKLDSESLGVGRYHEHARNTLSETVFNLSHNASYKARGNELMWGLSYQFEQINDHVSEWKMRDSSGYALPFSSDKINFEYSLRGQFNHSANRFMAYIQDTYKFHFNNEDVFSVTAGVRTHFYDFNKEWIVSPRVLMSYVPHWKHNFVFRLASGLYSQPPFYKELKTVRLDENNNGILYLNSKIKSQKSVQVVGGFDYYFKLGVRPFKLTVETYYKHLYDIVPYNVDNVQIIYQGSNNATGYSAGVDMKLFGEFIKGTDSWISLSFMRTEEDLKDDEYVDSEGKVHHPGYIPRPTDQRFNISIFFQDYFPKFPKNKFNIKMIFAGGLPTGPPKGERYQATYRMHTYIRVDLGYSRQLIGGKPIELRKQHVIKNMWMQLEVLNLLGIKNVNSYYWITGVNSVQYAVPNYLTGRQFNVKLLMDF
ncbi:MAG: TonB-dependent receptor, partial [Paludibacteraceae bacterium]|nr:TonB-dependent receptor [Paludibacteraceae bacterium]